MIRRYSGRGNVGLRMDTFFRVFTVFSYLNSGISNMDIYKCPILGFLSSPTKKQLIGHVLGISVAYI